MPEPHYLPGTPFDHEDFAAAQVPVSEPDPSDEGVVFLNWVSLEEDLWTVSWQRGGRHAGATGTRAEMVQWAMDRSASRRWIFDSSVDDYVPLDPPDR